MDGVKKCSKSKTISSICNFYKDRTKNDGYRPSCKNCSKQYYYNNEDRILNNHKTYIKNNRSKINAYERQKRKSDFNFKLHLNIRGRTNRAFKCQNDKTVDLIECTNSFLRKWIIHQLYGNTTLENYGKVWCLDHCLPLSKIDLSNGNNLYIFTNWINLRPMYKKDNIIDSDKIDHHLYLLQEVKAKYFLKINNDQEGLN